MSKLIPMEQAATMLGMSVEQINELRSNQEIFGYKDGGTWKFKMTELERVADNLGVCLLYTSPSPRDRTRSRMPSSA